MRKTKRELVALICNGQYQVIPTITEENANRLYEQCPTISKVLGKNIDVKYGFEDKDFEAQGFCKYDGPGILYEILYHEYKGKADRDLSIPRLKLIDIL